MSRRELTAEERADLDAKKKLAIECGGLTPEAADMVEPLVHMIGDFVQKAGPMQAILLLEEGVKEIKKKMVFDLLKGLGDEGKVN